jgi:serine protease
MKAIRLVTNLAIGLAASLVLALPAASAGAGQQDGVPARPVAGTFTALSDTALWTRLAATHQVAVVGLKQAGRARGIWKQSVLLTAGQWRAARRAVLSRPGVTLIRADSDLPVLTVRLNSPRALADLRRQPYVDYLEPPAVSPRVQSGSSSGCYDAPYDNASWGPKLQDAGSNIVPWNFPIHHIPEAWARATGAKVAVGVVDTGIYGSQALLKPGLWNQDNSGNPTRRVENTQSAAMGGPFGDCSHGTRAAGTIAAPRLGYNIVGVAWQADLITVHVLDGVAISSDAGAASVADGINEAYRRGARIINLSIGWPYGWYSSVADTITSHLNDTLFVAAAGTVMCGNGGNTGFGQHDGVIFPASVPGVVAATSLSRDLQGASDACWGSQVSLAIVNEWVQGQASHVPATGLDESTVIDFGGTSDAAAVTSGIAALIWSRYPTYSAAQVKDRLLSSTYPLAWGFGRGWPDAYAAVGGFRSLSITSASTGTPGAGCAPNRSDDQLGGCPAYVLTAAPSGDGPFTYRWNTGSNSPSIAVSLSGTYSVTVTDTVENKTLTASLTVSATPKPAPTCRPTLKTVCP